jgi:hypothetical protein
MTRLAVEEDERTILAICLGLENDTAPMIVHASTGIGPGNRMHNDDLERTREYLQRNLHDASEETIADFVAKNRQPYPVWPELCFGDRLIPLSDKEIRDIFAVNSGWDRFREAYPTSTGLAEFSRVGFDATRKEALVYVGVQFDWLMGSGSYQLMRHSDDGWHEVQSVMAWIS